MAGLERVYPFVGSSALALVWLGWRHDGYRSMDALAVLQTCITVSSITIGFLATAKAILLSSNSRLIRDMRRQGCFLRFVRFLNGATLASFCSVALSSLCIFVRWNVVDDCHTFLFAAWMFVASLSAMMTFRAVRAFCVYLETEAQAQ